MVFALTWQTLVRALALSVIAAVCLFVLIDGGATSAEIWARRGILLTLLVGFLGVLGIPQVFSVMHKLTLAEYWMFPLLDGQWEAHLCSNWPRIRRTYETAKAGGVTFDALVDPLTGAEERERHVAAIVTIRSSLFLISMTLRPIGSQRVSRTRFMRPLWRRPDLPELSYVFEQEDLATVAHTDERKHFGAGIVRYDPDTEELAGEYWNNRREDAGLNTAGTIRMRRA